MPRFEEVEGGQAFDALQPHQPERKLPTVPPAFVPIMAEMYDDKYRGQWFEHVRRSQIDFTVKHIQEHVDGITRLWRISAPRETGYINGVRASFGLEGLE